MVSPAPSPFRTEERHPAKRARGGFREMDAAIAPVGKEQAIRREPRPLPALRWLRPGSQTLRAVTDQGYRALRRAAPEGKPVHQPFVVAVRHRGEDLGDRRFPRAVLTDDDRHLRVERDVYRDEATDVAQLERAKPRASSLLRRSRQDGHLGRLARCAPRRRLLARCHRSEGTSARSMFASSLPRRDPSA